MVSVQTGTVVAFARNPEKLAVAGLVTLAERGLVRHTVKVIRLEDVNENLELLRTGEIVGRAVIKHG